MQFRILILLPLMLCLSLLAACEPTGNAPLEEGEQEEEVQPGGAEEEEGEDEEEGEEEEGEDD